MGVISRVLQTRLIVRLGAMPNISIMTIMRDRGTGPPFRRSAIPTRIRVRVRDRVRVRMGIVWYMDTQTEARFGIVHLRNSAPKSRLKTIVISILSSSPNANPNPIPNLNHIRIPLPSGPLFRQELGLGSGIGLGLGWG